MGAVHPYTHRNGIVESAIFASFSRKHGGFWFCCDRRFSGDKRKIHGHSRCVLAPAGRGRPVEAVCKALGLASPSSLITANGAAYRSQLLAKTFEALGIQHTFTRRYRPQTNGKAERFIQTCYPGEVEQVIFTHPAVKDCAVVGAPDEKWARW